MLYHTLLGHCHWGCALIIPGKPSPSLASRTDFGMETLLSGLGALDDAAGLAVALLHGQRSQRFPPLTGLA